jgi:uncharacterized repeat protein (TIGR01451 family)
MRFHRFLPAFVCAVFAVAPSALAQSGSDFSVNKSGPSTAFQGTDVVFDVAVTNNGPATGAVTMDDVIANGWIFISVTSPAGFSCSAPASGATSGTVSCTNPAMAAGSATIQITLRMPDNAPPNTPYPNTATVSSPTDTNNTNDSSTASTSTPPSTDISVVKTGPAQAAADTDVSFTITVSNLGPNDATTGVSMNDNVVGWTFVSIATPAGWSCSDPGAGNTGPVSCSTAGMTAGSSATFTLVVHIPAQTPDGTFFTNTATVSSAFDFTEENNSSTAVTGTPPAPTGDVSITKSGPSAAPPNSDVTYSITVTNLGPNNATNVSWTDTLPAGAPPGSPMTFVSFNQTSGPTFNCPAPSTTVTCTIATLAAGATATFSFVGHIPSGTAPGTFYSNSATVTSDNDPNPENNVGSTGLLVESADLGVIKSGPATAIAGGPTFNYIVTLSNSGPDTATDAGFSDQLPAGLTFVSLVQNTGPAAICSNPGVGANGTVACTIAAFGNGASAQFTITVQPLPSIQNGTVLSNTATTNSAGADTNPNNNSSTVLTTVSAQADVSIVKNGPASATTGTDITYTITAANGGPSDASNASWSDTLPANTTFVSFVQNTGPAFTCTTGATVSCSIATLTSGSSATFTLVVHLAPSAANASTVSNTANITSTTPDNAPGNNTSTVNTTVTANADLGITKSGPANVSAGNDISYSISLVNNGPSDAANVTWSDTLPANTTFVSFAQNTGPVFACTTGPTISCSIAALATGASATFTLVAHLSPAAANASTISNTATVTSTTTDNTAGNNSSTAQTVVAASADLAVTKSGPTSTPSNTQITYAVGVSNVGPSDAANVTLTDDVPAGTTFAAVQQTSGPSFNCTMPPVGGTGTITCTIASLPAGAAAAFQFTFNVLPSDTSGTVITNTANVSATTADPNAANNSATAMTTVGVSIPALSPLMLAMLAAMLAGLALLVLRR